MSKKMGVGLHDLLPRFTCTDAPADVLSPYDYEKRCCSTIFLKYLVSAKGVKLRKT